MDNPLVTRTLQKFIYKYASDGPAYQSFLRAHLLDNETTKKKSLFDNIIAKHGDRITYYQYAWDLYLGKHWFFNSQRKPDLTTVNYIAISINKNVSFLMNKGFLVESDFPDIEKLLQRTWAKNLGGEAQNNLLGWDIGLTGSVTGDAWINTLYTTDNFTGEEYIKLEALNSLYCYPVYTFNKQIGFLYYGIEEFVTKEQSGFSEYDIQMGGHYYTPGRRVRIVNEVPLATEDFSYLNIPIVHIKNFPTGALSPYGFSDIRNVSELNRLYNKLLTNVGDIVEYQGSPVTIIKGAKGGDLVRGANRVWSLLSKDASIENLELKSDLGAIKDHIERIGDAMRESGNIPASSTGAKDLSISNTSASALAITFMPLYEVMELKRIMYGTGFLKINKNIISMEILKGNIDVNKIIKERIKRWYTGFKDANEEVKHKNYPFSVPINERYDYNSLEAYSQNKIPAELFESYLTWYPPLPRDEKVSNDIALANINAKIWSRRHGRSFIGMKEEESIRMDIEIEDEKKIYESVTITNKTGLSGNPDVAGNNESIRRGQDNL